MTDGVEAPQRTTDGSTDMSENPHSVEVFVERNPDYEPDAPWGSPDQVRDVVFTCTAPDDAPCRTHPKCDCESWYVCDDPVEHEERGHTSASEHDAGDHPFVTGQECWVRSWFDGESAVYVGDDFLDARDDCVPPIAARGAISVSFEGDYIEWDWAPSEVEVSR